MSHPRPPRSRPAGLGRREVLYGTAGLGAAALADLGCGGAVVPAEPTSPFLHGVASGDPLPDAVILWTRVTIDEDDEISVSYRVARDIAMRDVVTSGEVATDATRDFTVKIDVEGLSPHTIYYYQFEFDGLVSPIGRTKTSALDGVSRLRVGVVSCSSYAHGFFNAYRMLTARDELDLIIHLGDYVYEQANGTYGNRRSVEPAHAIVTLDDYRLRYAHYRSDPDLQAIHRSHPFVTVWDDHEFANNASISGATGHLTDQGDWTDRRLAGLRAYYEWMPIRERARGQVWRSFRYGDLVELFILDARMWARGSQTTASNATDEGTLLGEDQDAWLAQELGSSDATFKLIGQQVLMSRLDGFGNRDGWAAFPEARQRFFDILTSNELSGVVVLTGDVHASIAIDLTPDPFGDAYDADTGIGSLAVELVVPPVTSPSILLEHPNILSDNPHLMFGELESRGYILLDITPEEIVATWYFVDTIAERSDSETVGGRVVVGAGERWTMR